MILLVLVAMVFTISGAYLFYNSKISQPNQEQISEQNPSPTPTPEPLIIRGSIPYWDQERAFESLKNNPAAFDEIALFWYYLTKDGSIKKYQYTNENKEIIDFAHANNIKVVAVITNLPDRSNTSWDSERVEDVLSDEDTRHEHIDDIVSLTEDLNFDGISIDYEEVDSSQKENFSQFIKELSEALHIHNKFLGVALHPKTKDTKDDRFGFQDWQKLGEAADQLYIMSYNEHWDTGKPGPIASIPWVKEIIEYSKSQKIQTSKLFLGIPLYGYDWEEDSDEEAEGLTYEDIIELINEYEVETKRDEKSGAPYFSYENDDSKHIVWYEDTKSIMEKINLVKEAGFGGVTFWRLGGEDQSIWTSKLQ